jgi:DNA-binding response OmpR family regulator
MARTILVVDSDPQARSTLVEILENAGYRTVSADGVATATRILQEARPDLVVTEIRLDGYNGLHLIATAPEPLRAVVVTAYADPTIESDARRFGADYLTQPVDPEALLAAVARQLSRGRDEAMFAPARQWPRIDVHDVERVDLDGRPARVVNVSDGGACLELEEWRPNEHPGPVTLRRGDVEMPMYVAWERRLAAGRWLCGVQTTTESAEPWTRIVRAVLRPGDFERSGETGFDVHHG